MEKIKVNMNPNPLDVQTIHASQNDGEARQWGFELHNNGEKIDSSSISDQLVFKAYEGGTEEILPTNGSTPTTSPFIGDIKYPQGLLTDQYFTYRESPTPVDGLAKIKRIKGNTLVWNQLQLIPTNSSTTSNGITFTNNNDGSVTANGTATGTAIFYCNSFPLTSGHKYLFKGCPSGGTSNTYMQSIRVNSASTIIGTDVGNGDVYTANANYTDGTILLRIMSGVTLNNAKFYPQVFDLTQMGLDSITDPSDFTSLFSLPYYAYNQGSLLSFNGTGLKSVGKNLIKPYPHSGTLSGVDYTFTEDGTLTAFGTATSTSSQFILIDGRITNIVRGAYYFLSGGDDKIRLRITTFDSSGNAVRRSNTSSTSGNLRFMFNDEEVEFYVSASAISTGVNINSTLYPQLELSYDKTSFEPYTESVLSLPISTYFPSGMKSAGSVYDELTPTKAITRIGAVDLGSLTWEYLENYQCFITYPVITDSAVLTTSTVPNFKSIYKAVAWVAGATNVNRDMIVCYTSSAHQLRVRNKNFTDPTAFKTAMSGVYLYYEMATPTETSFTTASLVTENAEIPLSNEDGVLIGKCTEQLSAEPGFIDAKIKLSDGDGECYSNKIQLHIERSPQ